jgi:succinate dehydrogenase / fumarate reductase cytochrome b subunit
MAILGTILLVYIVVHMGDFWYKFHNEPLPYVQYTENVTTGEVVTKTMDAGYTQEVKIVEMSNEAAGTHSVIVKDLFQEVRNVCSGISPVSRLSKCVPNFRLESP